MNKIILLSAIVISIAAISCKKERSCECTYTNTTVTTFNSGGTFTNTDVSTSKVTAEKQTKKFFRTHNACYSYTSKNTQIESNYTDVTTNEANCTLK